MGELRGEDDPRGYHGVAGAAHRYPATSSARSSRSTSAVWAWSSAVTIATASSCAANNAADVVAERHQG
jgi:hypothetical protein